LDGPGTYTVRAVLRSYDSNASELPNIEVSTTFALIVPVVKVATKLTLAIDPSEMPILSGHLTRGGHSYNGARVTLQKQRDALLAEVRGATGLGGRARETGGTDERARVAVRKAIVAAIERITAVDPDLGRLLTHAVRTGTHCRYDPDPARPTEWVLESSPQTADL
jgi:hypothetical protein